MTDRFNPSIIINAHLKGLKNRVYTSERPLGIPDVLARAVLYLVPIGAGVAAYFFDLSVANPSGLIEVSGILIGAFFVGFTQVAVWRERFTERFREREFAEVHQRDSLDEAVAHLLMAIYGTIGLIITVVVGNNFTNSSGELVGVSAALALVFGVYVLMLLTIVLPKLYAAYATVNKLDREMSGLDH